MKEVIKGFFTENGIGSSKRLIAISIATVLGWSIVFACVRATTDTARQALINSTMIFVLIMSGVATVSQVVSIIRGNKIKDDEPKV